MYCKGLVLLAALVLQAAALPCAIRAEEGNASPKGEAAAGLATASSSPARDLQFSYAPSAANGDCRGRECAHWIAETEVSFLSARVRTGGRITMSFNDSTTPGTDMSITDQSGLFDYAVAPRLVLGRQFGEKWAVVARYWTLTDADSPFPELTPGTTPQPNFATFLSSNSAKLYTIDLEGVRSFSLGAWKFDVTAGGRHASLDVDSAVAAFGVFTTGNFVNLTLANGCSFNGNGFTGSLTARRQLGSSPFSLFAGCRGTAAYGHSDSYGRVYGAVASSPSAPLVGAATVMRNNADAEMEIFELQFGLQWEYRLACVPATAFFRSALEWQHWNFMGPPTGGAGFGGTIGNLTTNSFSSAGIGDTDLVGLTCAAGFTW